MKSLVVLTESPIDVVLQELDVDWRIGSPRVEATGSGAGGPTGSPSAMRTDARAGSLAGRESWGLAGAWLDFYGVVRGTEGEGSTISAIEYEAHPTMAQHQLQKCVDRVGSDFPLLALLVIHRVGRVPVGESSLLVRTLSAHRAESLEACAALINLLKEDVPIWKHPV